MIDKNVIIGTVVGYTPDKFKNFVLSFRKFNKVDDLILLVDTISSDKFFTDNNVKQELFISYKWIETTVNNARYIAYKELLSRINYKRIFLTDVRDVIVQSDPFAELPTDEFLYLFNEDSGYSINKEVINYRWINRIYGEDIANQMALAPIVCSGTMIGTPKLIERLVDMVCDHLFTARKTTPVFFKEDTFDQGIVNYIAHYNLIPYTKKVSGDIVGTIGLSFTDIGTDEISFGDGNVFVNKRFPAIIHQYDRNDMLQKYYDEQYIISE